MTFSSNLKAKNGQSMNLDKVSFADILKVGERRKSYLDTKEILIPDSAFLLHIELSVPKLSRFKEYSCLIYSNQQTLNRSNPEDSQSSYTIVLALDNECNLTLCFKPFSVDSKTETGLAALKRLFPGDSVKSLEVLKFVRFILVETKCECCFPQGEIYLGDPSMNYMGSMPNSHYQNQDAYTINNTQNNYYFGNGGYHTQHQYPPWSDQFGDSYPGEYENMHGQEYGEYGHNGWSEPGMNNGKARPQAKQAYQGGGQKEYAKTDSREAYRSSSYQGVEQELWGRENLSMKLDGNQLAANSKNGISEEDLQSSDEEKQGDMSSTASGNVHTIEEILKDSRLFKNYANSKNKNPIIQSLVTALSDEQTQSMLETLKPLAKEICKNKYGNYIIQVIAKSLPEKHLPAFLEILRPSLIEIICHPKGTFAVQGVIAALKTFETQQLFVEMIKPNLGWLVKNKDGSYIVKELYRHFDPKLLEKVTTPFLADLGQMLSDKFAICIFKEIVLSYSKEPKELLSLISQFASHFPGLKTNTFYHFGIQYFLEVTTKLRRFWRKFD